MLDLSLDHLGLITQPEDEAVPGQIASGLAKVVEDIGEGAIITINLLSTRATADSGRTTETIVAYLPHT